MNNTIRIGSRASRLAVAQSNIVTDIINRLCPQYNTELVTIKTTGDRILDKTLDKVGGKGLFVKELDKALLQGDADITVHSLKDVPMETDERILIAAYTKCLYPQDVLVLPKNTNEIDFSKPVGTASMRRAIQFKHLYPQADIKPVRGNVITRLDKLDRGEYSALILARAGIERLGLSERISRVFGTDEIIPAAGQGIIAVQARKDCNYEFLKYIDDYASRCRAEAERAFVKALDGGCSSPIAAYAVLSEDNKRITITGFYADDNLTVRESISGSTDDRAELGIMLADKIKKVI